MVLKADWSGLPHPQFFPCNLIGPRLNAVVEDVTAYFPLQNVTVV